MNRVKQIHEFGQSIWLDFIDRKIMDSGELQQLIDEDGVRGITSNPAIFEKAVSSSRDYDADISELAQTITDDEELFYALAVKDIQRAADLFHFVYAEKVRGSDGYVSLEVSPLLARDTNGTVAQALRLWDTIDRENLMIKIPGTAEGLPAIEQCIARGLNINVTLLFGLERYEAVANAYLTGLERRDNAGLPIDHVASVASFFLSRIDTLIDPVLSGKGLAELRGKVAIASAKKAYEIYQRLFTSDRFLKLAARGAKSQRLLWASTGSKDPAFSDVKYVETLIGPNTVNTVPMDTLVAFRDHGVAVDTLELDLDGATKTLQRLAGAGIGLATLTQQLEEEGIEKFNVPYQKLLNAIQTQRAKVLA